MIAVPSDADDQAHLGTPVGPNHARFTLAEVAQLCGGELVGAKNPQLELAGIVTNTRRPLPGTLFVALRGERFDAHDFVEGAVAAGCSAALVDRLVPVAGGFPLVLVADTGLALGQLAAAHRQRFSLPVVAVTGSYGKTTARALLAAVLAPLGEVHTSQGNYNNEVGLPLTLLQLDAGHAAAVLEMGMRGLGEIAYLARTARPTVGVITNIGPQHIELLETIENIASAKAELLRELPREGLAVVPFDSPFLEELRSAAPCRVVTFGSGVGSDYRVTQVVTAADGTIEFRVNDTPVRLPLPGAHNALNAAAAFAVAHELGVTPEAIATALSRAAVPGARMRVLRLSQAVTVIDDCYNAGPDSMRAALTTLLDFPGGGRRVAILGAMKELGAHSEAEHRRVGQLAGEVADVLVGVGPETRPLLNSAVDSAAREERTLQISYADSATEASERVGEWVEPKDVVLVKGSRSVRLEVVVARLTAQWDLS